MHDSSYLLMTAFVNSYVKGVDQSVCDIGSMNVNGTYKDLFKNHNYVGLDISAGDNVDVVAKDMYTYPFEDCSFDVVISGQTIEHVKNIFLWIKEVTRIAKHNGLVCVVGPMSHSREHRHPVDCWRVFPDGMIFLMEEIAGLEVLSILRSKNDVDCMGIARKI